MTSTDTTAETIRCRHCRRPLRSAVSRSLGIGPRCAAIEAAMEGLDDKQAAKALELVADKAVIPTTRKGVYRIPASDGGEAYTTSVTGHCNCRWGLRRTSDAIKPCAHVGAAKLTLRPVLTLAQARVMAYLASKPAPAPRPFSLAA